MFTEKETALLMELLSKATISPTQPNAVEVLTSLQTIIDKLQTKKEETKE